MYAEAKKNVEEAMVSKAEAEGLEDEELELSKGKDVEIIPLGTGSAVPTKYRNGELFLCTSTMFD